MLGALLIFAAMRPRGLAGDRGSWAFVARRELGKRRPRHVSTKSFAQPLLLAPLALRLVVCQL